MNWKAHFFLSLFLYGITLFAFGIFNYFFDLHVIIAGFLITIAYGLLPDIDHDISKINNIIEILFLGTALAGLISFFVFEKKELVIVSSFLVGLILATKFLRHRGITHTIRFGLISALPLWFANPFFVLFAFIAFLSHLLADLQIKL